jgi:serine/threonine protein phosphatase 1
MSKTYIVGDIHGCYYTLLEVISQIRTTYEEGDNLVFLGDYFDRGKQSWAVYSTLKNLHKSFKSSNIVLLRGNHEQMWLDAMKDKIDECLWFSNGGEVTVESFRDAGISDEEMRKWLSKLPYVWYNEENDFYCVHAHLPHTTIEDFTEEDYEECLWTRRSSSVRKRVFHGHTVHRGTVVMVNNDIDLDTGCVFGYGLSFAIVEKNKVAFSTIPTHPCDKVSSL